MNKPNLLHLELPLVRARARLDLGNARSGALPERHGDLHRFLKLLISHRLHLVAQHSWHDQALADFLRQAQIQIHGIKLDQPDLSHESHSLAFTVRGLEGGMIHLMINAYWEALAFELPPAEGVVWRRLIDTALASPDDICTAVEAPPEAGPTYLVQPHSIAYLFAQSIG